MASPRSRKRSTPKITHAWSEHCDHVNVYRVLKSNGREVRVILGHRYAPEEMSDELALKRLHGPGHYVLSPRTEGNAICGDEKRFVVPNEDGSIPPMAVEGDGASGLFGGAAPGREGPPSPWEFLRGLIADQRAAQKELLAEQREARKADMAAMAMQFDNFAKVIVAQVGGEKQSDGVFFKRLEKFEKDAADLRQKLHEKELSIALAKKASNVEDFVTDVAKSVGPDVVRTFLGVGAGAGAASSPAAQSPALTASTVPLETLVAQLPPADEIARDLAAGKTMDPDEITCYTRLATAGKLSDDHRRVIGAYLSKGLWNAG